MAAERSKETTDRTEPVVIPPTEVAGQHQPQPDAGKRQDAEDIPDGQMESSRVNTGKEITDGEAG